VTAGAIAVGGIQVQERIGLASGDEGCGRHRGLFPKIRIAGEIDFFRQFVENADRHRFEQVIFRPFVVIVTDEPASVGACEEIIVGYRAIDDRMTDGIDKFFRGRKSWPGAGKGRGAGEVLGTGAGSDGKDKEQGKKPVEHVTMIGKRTLMGS
jgi:hypothetical protein